MPSWTVFPSTFVNIRGPWLHFIYFLCPCSHPLPPGRTWIELPWPTPPITPTFTFDRSLSTISIFKEILQPGTSSLLLHFQHFAMSDPFMTGDCQEWGRQPRVRETVGSEWDCREWGGHEQGGPLKGRGTIESAGGPMLLRVTRASEIDGETRLGSAEIDGGLGGKPPRRKGGPGGGWGGVCCHMRQHAWFPAVSRICLFNEHSDLSAQETWWLWSTA